MYYIKYHKLIDNEDGNIYKKILEIILNKNLNVKEVKCNNHLLHNLCNKLKETTTIREVGPPKTLREYNFMRNIARCSSSLLQDVGNNIVESYNSIVGKVIGDQRINYAMKGLIIWRCMITVVNKNT